MLVYDVMIDTDNYMNMMYVAIPQYDVSSCNIMYFTIFEYDVWCCNMMYGSAPQYDVCHQT